MNMKKFRVFAVVLVLAMIVAFSWNLFPAKASSLGIQSSAVSDGSFTVTVTLPAVRWGAFDFTLQFDPAVVGLSAKPKVTTVDDDSYEISTTRPAVDSANASGSYLINGVGDVLTDMTNSGTKIVYSFTVKSTSAQSTAVKVVVNEFVDPTSSALIAAGTEYSTTVTLKQAPVTPPSSDDPTPPASSDTPTPPPASDSNTPTDTPTPPPSSDSNTPSDNPKPPASSGNTGDSQTSQDPSIKTDTDTGTQPDGSDSDTPVDSQGSDTVGSTDTADNSGTSDFSGSSHASTSSQNRPVGSSSDAGKDSTGISSLTLGLIAGGISILFCAVLTVLALLRRRK